MDEQPRYAIGVDLGTENTRAVVLEVRKDGLGVIGYGEARSTGGISKGVVIDLDGPAKAVDTVLAGVEKMSGVNVDAAYVSVNGSHLVSIRTNGMITISGGQEINSDDLRRLEDSAISGCVPQNRDIIDVVPLSYLLDGQSGIRNPIGMNATRLEMKANVVSGLTPSCEALSKAMTRGGVRTLRMVPTAMAAARAVLTERQRENGVVLVNIGATTTSVAVYGEGDLQYVGVLNLGANDITNDLAVILEINTEMAEELKLKYATADLIEGDKPITMKYKREEVTFTMSEVSEIVGARLEDIFVHVNELLKKAGYERKLPEGAVIVGGGAKMRGIAGYAKTVLKMATRVGVPGKDLAGVADAVEKTEYATALGLAMMMADDGVEPNEAAKGEKKKKGLFGKIFG